LALTNDTPSPIARSTTPPHWLSKEEVAQLTPDELVRRAKALKPLLREHALECETLRRPVDSVWEEIRRGGFFYMLVPKIYGGLQYGAETFLDAMLPLAEGCASTGWVTAFCVEHNWILAQFPKEAQDDIFGTHPYIIAPGINAPSGTLTPVKGGYRINGRYRWATGIMHADWVLATAVLQTERGPRIYLVAIPADDAVVLDTWHVDGMAGTGTNDVLLEDVFVPEHRLLDAGKMRRGASPGALLHGSPIYRMPMLTFLASTAAIAAVGTARAAVDTFREQLPQRPVIGTKTVQADRQSAQVRLGRVHTMVTTAEMLLRQALIQTEEMGGEESGGSPARQTEVRAQIAYSVSLCRKAIGTIGEAAGASAHTLSNPLQRALRDINTMSNHTVFDIENAFESQGRSMLGLPPGPGPG
jgi:3-hydroxy-9,10-secoandrosta-1,3,5(10)-triene-9,17-dione monooxygenase